MTKAICLSDSKRQSKPLHPRVSASLLQFHLLFLGLQRLPIALKCTIQTPCIESKFYQFLIIMPAELLKPNMTGEQADLKRDRSLEADKQALFAKEQ